MTSIQNLELITERRARVAKLGEFSEQVQHVWIVLHGYRQLGENFIKPFADIVQPDTLILAPEALSRFYIDGFWGDVGASWMTKVNREAEIIDQVVYLDKVVEMVDAKLPQNYQLHVLGFSQGVATLWRWLIHGKAKPHSISLWAGGISDERSEAQKVKIEEAHFHLIYATEDQFIPLKAAEDQIKVLKGEFPNLQSIKFEGKHQLKRDVLKDLRDRVV